jgi:two-component system, OmpR family, phosphate regulon response regulator PhoB
MAKRILFADDEEDIRLVVGILLAKAGYITSMYGDGSFMNDIDLLEVPDIYILDRRMGKTDALEICYLLKAHPKTKHVPVIMVSADPKIKDLYKAAGADAFIPKPFEQAIFLDTIAHYLK